MSCNLPLLLLVLAISDARHLEEERMILQQEQEQEQPRRKATSSMLVGLAFWRAAAVAASCYYRLGEVHRSVRVCKGDQVFPPAGSVRASD